MKRLGVFLMSIGISLSSCSVSDTSKSSTRMTINPILAGFYPDPSICRVGSDYYLVTSTFAYYPGIPVFHSTNLAEWQLEGYVMDRPEQLDLDGLGVSRGLFAPSIRYNEGIFYVTCTLVDGGGNFIVKTNKAEGPWSNPVWIPEINGIDPSLFFDANGKVYILYNSIPPDNQPLYDGHRTIRMYEFDIVNLKVIGEEKILINGGVDISKKPVWIEGPHIFKKNGFYYLIAAEGGTADQHSEVVFRSEDVWGPYISFGNNPILTQRHLDPKRKNAITSTGHADFVETENGSWWAVFLGCRPYPPYEQGYYNTGRETFLAPVKWIAGWPVINPDQELIQYQYPVPVSDGKMNTPIKYSDNFSYRDDFNQRTLNRNWIFLRTLKENWYDLSQKNGFLSLRLRPETCSGKANPSFIAHRQQHLLCSVSTAIHFNPQSDNEKAGLVVFQNENHFYYLCQSVQNRSSIIQLYQSALAGDSENSIKLIASHKPETEDIGGETVFLKITAQNGSYSFYYGFKADEWQVLQEDVDGTFLSTRIAGGFVGCTFAMYATSLGYPSTNIAHFDWFEYQGNDGVYKD